MQKKKKGLAIVDALSAFGAPTTNIL